MAKKADWGRASEEERAGLLRAAARLLRARKAAAARELNPIRQKGPNTVGPTKSAEASRARLVVFLEEYYANTILLCRIQI